MRLLVVNDGYQVMSNVEVCLVKANQRRQIVEVGTMT